MKGVIGGTEERAAIQLVANTWFRKRNDEKFFRGLGVRIRRDKSFGDHLDW